MLLQLQARVALERQRKTEETSVALQSALDAEEKERAVLETENAEKDEKLTVLMKESADKSEELSAKETELDDMKKAHQDKEQKWLAQLQAAESSAADLRCQLNNEQQARANEQDQWQAQLQAAESSATDWQHQFENERGQRAIEHQQWQTQKDGLESNHNTLALQLVDEQQAHENDLATANDQLNRAESTYRELESKFEASEAARGNEQNQAAVTLESSTTALKQQCATEVQQERNARALAEQERDNVNKELTQLREQVANSESVAATQEEQIKQERSAKEVAEQERDNAIKELAELHSRMALSNAQASSQKEQYDTLMSEHDSLTSAHSHALDQIAALLDERSGREREVQQANQQRDVVQNQNVSLQKELASTKLTLETTQFGLEQYRHMSEMAATGRQEALATEIAAKVAANKRAKEAEKQVKLYQRSGAQLPKPKAKSKKKKENKASSDGFVSFGHMDIDESIEEAKARVEAEADDESEDDSDDEMDDDEAIAAAIPEVQRHTSPAPSSSASSQASSSSASDVDEEPLPSDSEFQKAVRLWDTGHLGTLYRKSNLVQKFLPGNTGTHVYIFPFGEWLLKIQPRPSDMRPDDRGNGILSFSQSMLGGRHPDQLSIEEHHFAVTEFEQKVVYACLPTTQIAAAKLINEDEKEDITNDLFSDNDQFRHLSPVMVCNAAGKFVSKMNELNKGSLLSMVDERSDKCCHELRAHPKIFKAAARQLAKTPQFVQTLLDVVNGRITNLEPGIGIWPAEVADHAAASRSLSANARVVEKRTRMGPPALPGKVADENDKTMASVLHDLDVDPKDSIDALAKLAKQAKIESKRQSRELPHQKDGPMKAKSTKSPPKPLKPTGIGKKSSKAGSERKEEVSEKYKRGGTGDGGLDAMFTFTLRTPPATPPGSVRSTPEPGSDGSRPGSEPGQSKKKPARSPFVVDDDDDDDDEKRM